MVEKLSNASRIRIRRRNLKPILESDAIVVWKLFCFIILQSFLLFYILKRFSWLKDPSHQRKLMRCELRVGMLNSGRQKR